MDDKKNISIVCFSGEFDKMIAAFTIATGAAATNREVTMFFTFWGLNALKKQQGRVALGKSVMARAFNFLMGGLKNLPLSRLNFFGASPKLMTGMMKQHNVATLAGARRGRARARREDCRLRDGHAHPRGGKKRPDRRGARRRRRRHLPERFGKRPHHLHLTGPLPCHEIHTFITIRQLLSGPCHGKLARVVCRLLYPDMFI